MNVYYDQAGYFYLKSNTNHNKKIDNHTVINLCDKRDYYANTKLIN